MKAKLIKTGNDYLLRDMNGEVLAITNGTTEGRKLSKQNCDSLFAVVDVKKLAEEEIPNDGYADTTLMQKGFIKGFKKAMELNKDKVFTEEDVRNAYSYGVSVCHSIGHSAINYTDKCIQSLQQPTEIPVEIEMECCGNYSPPCNINCEYGPKPKLDSEGCLVLKKI